MAGQDRFHAAAQDPLALAVDDAHREDPFFKAGLEVVVEQIGHIPGVEGVQIQDVGDGKFDGVHGDFEFEN